MILNNYGELLSTARPLLDVRAPVEFLRGALPGAVNVPLLEDDEREAVGIEYKQHGHEAAVALGHRLVNNSIRQSRLDRWIEFAQQHPDGALYCFRGGERSQIVQRWMAEAGCHFPRIEGGYKAMRQYLLGQLERLCTEQDVVLVGGRAGSGKTHLLNREIPYSVDLEGLAHHRGSAFGRRPGGQPGPSDFENSLIIDWLRAEAAGAKTVVMEDEGRTIGRLPVPGPLWERFERAPIAVLNVPFESRVAQILEDYVVANLAETRSLGADDAFAQFSNQLLDGLGRVHKKVGGERYRALQSVMLEALEQQRSNGELQAHKLWIAPLLRDYYDPMYDYQLKRKAARVEFTGSRAKVLQYLQRRG